MLETTPKAMREALAEVWEQGWTACDTGYLFVENPYDPDHEIPEQGEN